jgi:SAM-dependent methyltransferase
MIRSSARSRRGPTVDSTHGPRPDRRPSWDRLARGYNWQLSLERTALRALLDLLEIRQSEHLLDVATGTAALLGELARSAHRPARAVGIDSSREMLARAGPLPAAWQLVVADARDLQFDDGSFDVATAVYLLHVLDAADRGRVLGELRRVLRPDGRLGVITVAPPRTAVGALVAKPIRALAQRRGGGLLGLRALDPRPELIASGFRIIASRRTGRGYPSLSLVADRPATLPPWGGLG